VYFVAEDGFQLIGTGFRKLLDFADFVDTIFRPTGFNPSPDPKRPTKPKCQKLSARNDTAILSLPIANGNGYGKVA